MRSQLRNCNTIEVRSGSTKYEGFSSNNKENQYETADLKKSQKWVPSTAPAK